MNGRVDALSYRHYNLPPAALPAPSRLVKIEDNIAMTPLYSALLPQRPASSKKAISTAEPTEDDDRRAWKNMTASLNRIGIIERVK